MTDTDISTDETGTDGTGTQAEWVLPFEKLVEHHRGRIDGHEDLVPLVVEGWYEGADAPQWQVTTVGSGPDITTRDAGLHAATLLASITGCDYIVLSFDTHATSLQHNPKTGKPWGPGEMQAMCDEEGFCETGQMVDVLQVAVVRRSDAKIRMKGIPYHFHQGNLIFYDAMPDGIPMGFDEWEHGDTQTTGGVMPDALRAAMRAPTVNSYRTQHTPLDRIDDIMLGITMLYRSADVMGHPDMYAAMFFAQTEAEKALLDEFNKLAEEAAENQAEDQTAEPSPAP